MQTLIALAALACRQARSHKQGASTTRTGSLCALLPRNDCDGAPGEMVADYVPWCGSAALMQVGEIHDTIDAQSP